MIAVCDLRDSVRRVPDDGAKLLLLTHCTRDRWMSLFVQLEQVYSSTHPAVLVPSDGASPTTLPLEQLKTEFANDSDYHVVIPAKHSKALNSLNDLIEIVATLRSPDGCPWDRAQTPQSLTPYILEEAYETVAAIRSNDIDHTVEELGDLLLQVVLQSQVFSESDTFNLGDVARGISAKLIRRHPHVFGPEASSSKKIEEVKQKWEEIKQEEKGEETLQEKLVAYATTFPPLLGATKIVKKTAGAADTGNAASNESMESVRQQLKTVELLLEKEGTTSANDADELAKDEMQAAFGQLLFSIVRVAHRHGIKVTDALDTANWSVIHQLPSNENSSG